MGDTRRTLQNINEFIRDELFPTIGLPYETLRKRYIDIPNNLMDIRDALKRLQTIVQHGNTQLNNYINTSREIQNEIQNYLSSSQVCGRYSFRHTSAAGKWELFLNGFENTLSGGQRSSKNLKL